jgi:hypothetical protein
MPKGKRLTREQKEAVIADYRRGLLCTRILADHGIANGSLNNILQEFNEPRRRRDFVPGLIDLTGQVFDRLEVVERVPIPDGKVNRSVMWRCRCHGPPGGICGNIVEVTSSTLRTGNTRSCGCLQRETAAEQAASLGRASTTHGETNTPEFEAWHGMIQRCHNQNCKDYPTWGGKGVRVCDEWRASYEAFRDYLLASGVGRRPAAGYSLDRYPNNRGNYEPGNIRWATTVQQARNRTNNVNVEYDGRSQCYAAWAEEARINGNTGLTTNVLYSRHRINNWDFKVALETRVTESS